MDYQSTVADQSDTIIAFDEKGEKIKVILIGEQKVGKSLLLKTLLNVESEYNDKMIQSIDFMIVKIPLNEGLKQKVYMWITSGELKNLATITPFLRQCHMYIITFSLADNDSLKPAIDKLFHLCLKNSRKQKASYIIIGTKADKERKVPPTTQILELIRIQLETYYHENNKDANLRISGLILEDLDNLPDFVKYHECSAADGQGIPEILQTLQTFLQGQKQKREIEKILELEKQRESEQRHETQFIENQIGTPRYEENAKVREENVTIEKQEKGCIKGCV